MKDSPLTICKLEDSINQKLLQKNARKVLKSSAEKLSSGKESVKWS